MGTSKNHKATNQENKKPAEAGRSVGMHLSPEIHEPTMLCVCVRCRDEARRIQSSAISIQTRINLFLRQKSTTI
jgi:hypothetical protein